MTYTIIIFILSTFAFLFFQLDYKIFAFSPSFERQEITDGDKDWIFWPSDSQRNNIDLQDKTLQSIPVAKNESDCKLDVEFSPHIESISYSSNGNILNTTLWMSADLIESILQKNRLNKDNLEKETPIPLWKKIRFTVAIDINSIFDQGTDYRIEIANERINFTTQKWTESIYEIAANGEKKIVSKKLFDEFPYINKNFIDFTIDLNKIGNPKNYKILFYVTDIYVKDGRLCRMVDSTNWILSPPPDFNLLISDNPINMNPGEENDIFVTINSNTPLQAEAELYINNTYPSLITLSFPIGNKTLISSLTNGTSLLHLDVSDSYFDISKRLVFPIIANITFAPIITNKGGDTFHTNQTIFLSEIADLTVNIERSLLPIEQFEKYVGNLKPIGEAWQILTPIGAGILSLIYFISKKRKNKEESKLVVDEDKKKVKTDKSSSEEKRSPI